MMKHDEKKMTFGYRLTEEAGHVYGFLTVLGRAERKIIGASLWRCRCACGKELDVRGNNLRNGTTKSCGCGISRLNNPNLIDELGKVYGKLTVIERSPRSPDRIGGRWICRCECGSETSVLGTSLRRGNNRSCGCLRSPHLAGTTGTRVMADHERKAW